MVLEAKCINIFRAAKGAAWLKSELAAGRWAGGLSPFIVTDRGGNKKWCEPLQTVSKIDGTVIKCRLLYRLRTETTPDLHTHPPCPSFPKLWLYVLNRQLALLQIAVAALAAVAVWYALWWCKVNHSRRGNEPPFHKVFIPVAGCGVSLNLHNVSFLRWLRERYHSTVVSSYMGSKRVHFMLDPHDVNVIQREGFDFSFLAKSVEMGCEFSDFDLKRMAPIPGRIPSALFKPLVYDVHDSLHPCTQFLIITRAWSR